MSEELKKPVVREEGEEKPLLIHSTGKLENVPFPDMTPEMKQEIEGTRIIDHMGREFILKNKVHKDLGNGDIVENVEAFRVSTAKTMHLGDGVEVDFDWDPHMYLEHMYDSYLDLVQISDFLFADKIMGKYTGKIYDEHSCFEEYCRDCLEHIKEQHILHKQKVAVNTMDTRVYNNAKAVLDLCEETLRKFLEGSIKF